MRFAYTNGIVARTAPRGGSIQTVQTPLKGALLILSKFYLTLLFVCTERMHKYPNTMSISAAIVGLLK